MVVLCAMICTLFCPAALAYESSTLYHGCEGNEVRELQQALIDLGYLKGTADGVFGNKTENAVRAFQKKNRLDIDGLAGITTRQLILSKAQAKKGTVSPAPVPVTLPSSDPVPEAITPAGSVPASAPVPVTLPSSDPVPEAVTPAGSVPASAPAPVQNSGEQTSASLFVSYATIRYKNSGQRVRSLQQALISLGFLSGSADGVFGRKTRNAVRDFQRSQKLSADGVAGKKTLHALESALAGNSSSASSPASVPASDSRTPSAADPQEDLNPVIAGPSAGSVRLLHWFNDVKPSLSGGQQLLIWDPSTGLSWTLRIHSCGRHCDAEPLTERDTRTMVAAFGGVNTWNQKAVYAQLPDGRWSVASTHDMPHDTGSIKGNGFNGHLCVHFLRDMDEAKKNDPKYGVANQETIRAYWKSLTGVDVP